MKHKIHFKYSNFNNVIEETIGLYTDIDDLAIRKYTGDIDQIIRGMGHPIVLFTLRKGDNVAKYICNIQPPKNSVLRLKYHVRDNSYIDTIIDPTL